MNSPAVTRRLLPRLLPLLLLPWLASAPAQSADPSWVYLDNGQLRLGVNEAAGAAIGWFSPSGSDQNRLNVYDVGRYVQQSYYGDSDKSDWNGTPWTYNPVQGGSWKNVPSMLIESRRDGDTYYAKTRPRHWATGALLEEVVMEQWLRLDGRTASLRFRMTYSGSVSHHPRHQELPALFVDAHAGLLRRRSTSLAKRPTDPPTARISKRIHPRLRTMGSVGQPARHGFGNPLSGHYRADILPSAGRPRTVRLLVSLPHTHPRAHHRKGGRIRSRSRPRHHHRIAPHLRRPPSQPPFAHPTHPHDRPITPASPPKKGSGEDY